MMQNKLKESSINQYQLNTKIVKCFTSFQFISRCGLQFLKLNIINYYLPIVFFLIKKNIDSKIFYTKNHLFLIFFRFVELYFNT